MSRPNVTYDAPEDAALAGLATNSGLSAARVRRLRGLVTTVERYPPAAAVRSLEDWPQPKWVLSGWACELRVLPDGRRQIFSFAIPGDVMLARPFSRVPPCTVMALTWLECVDVARVLARASDVERTELGRAFDRALAAHDDRRYDLIARLGRRSALERVADLLLELHDRLEPVGLLTEDGFDLPLTQEQMADALGLSLVHVNRSLRTLRLNGLATVRFGRVTGFDAPQLRALLLSSGAELRRKPDRQR